MLYIQDNHYRICKHVQHDPHRQNVEKQHLNYLIIVFSILYDNQEYRIPTILPENDSPSHNHYNNNAVFFSGYIQDKIEYDNFITNVGIRYDHFDPDENYIVNFLNPEGENKKEEISEHLWSILSSFNKAEDMLIKGDDNCLLLLLENSSQEYAETIVNRIIKIINGSYCKIEENDFEIKAIIGNATFPHDAEGPDSLISASIRSYEHSEIELD